MIATYTRLFTRARLAVVGLALICSAACMPGCPKPGNTVTFADPGIEAAVRAAIGKPNGTLRTSHLQGVGFTELDASLRSISDLTGLEACTDLVKLDLHGNCVDDLAPLGDLTGLTQLNLHDNAIADVSALEGLTNLHFLWLSRNNIDDVSPLAANTGLNGTLPTNPDRVALNLNPLAEDDVDLATLRANGAFVWTGPAATAKGACTPTDEAGDPIPISAALIHGDPNLPDDRAYVLLVLGDGFVDTDLGDPALLPTANDTHFAPFADATADVFNYFFQSEPFAEYADYFKVYRVDVISKDNRVSDTSVNPPVVNDTALGMIQESRGYDYDQDLIARVATNTGIDWDRVVLIPNGDSSGTFENEFLVFSNRRESRRATAVHEFGHSIGFLADEYEYKHGTNPPTPDEPRLIDDEPNVIVFDDAIPTLDDIPWKHWLMTQGGGVCETEFSGALVDFNCATPPEEDCQCEEIPEDPMDCVPIPTCEPGGHLVDEEGVIYGRPEWPEPGDSDSVIGLYEGGKYRDKGAWRSELRCRMRSVDDVAAPDVDTPFFCTVCKESLVEEIAFEAGHAAMAIPETATPIPYTSDGEDLSFEIVLHAVAAQEHTRPISNWFVDGVEQPNSSGLDFQLDPATLSAEAQHTVSVTVFDDTPWVHPMNGDGQSKIAQTLTWTLTKTD